MEKYKVFKTVKKSTLPKKAKVLSSTWAMKKKLNGTYCAQVTARGYEQVNGIHYDEDSKASPVVNEAMILIFFVLMLLAGWVGYIMDV
jgi:Reverse transcriptase (RNA-dependent DNA polymerase)